MCILNANGFILKIDYTKCRIQKIFYVFLNCDMSVGRAAEVRISSKGKPRVDIYTHVQILSSLSEKIVIIMC